MSPQRDAFDYGWFYDDGREYRVWEDRKCFYCKESTAVLDKEATKLRSNHYYDCPGCGARFIFDTFWNEVLKTVSQPTKRSGHNE